ncbi:hypothetical protein [Rhizobium mesoamericanum]|uniref:Uncharacterized protein n=1 Tax=Rhizobium mesoamericanum STM3625 TaxID=1211777 RepID=K0PTU4_9HYPH|nr:hypothetical protein [Rhizobium mesoamericanum]CCM77253.1 hypothetical protein BN77_4312 [Rhizobium mesoamericanum STM3625]
MLVEMQVPIGRPKATRAALILLRKNTDWWTMPQDERRAVLEEQSHHMAIGLRYHPAVARRLLHCRDMESEAPFRDMLGQLRSTEEWSFMEREIDIPIGQVRSLKSCGMADTWRRRRGAARMQKLSRHPTASNTHSRHLTLSLRCKM